MKNSTLSTLKKVFLRKHFSSLIILLASVIGLCAVPKHDFQFIGLNDNWTGILLPDTVIGEISEDTVVYSDGADTIYEINDSIPTNDSLGLYLRDIEPTTNFYVTLGGESKSVNSGGFGINVGGMFDAATFPSDGSSNYGWQWLVDLAPEVLRFPSGSFSKFTHLLHNTDGSDAVGYGYDIYEIARYFDWTDKNMEFDFDALTTTDIDHILYDDLNEVDVNFGGWISHLHANHFIKFREKWFEQQCVPTRYIDDFIELVTDINEAYPGRPSVRVLIDLNILSETATECRTIADYLRANDVNVVGVEMGNEAYDNFFCDALEFDSFGAYYNFINGTNLTDNENVLEDKPGTTNDMWGNHDFITKFKTGSGYNYKIGVCGMPLGEDYAFRIADEDDACALSDDWNSDLRLKYTDLVTGTSKYKFDAVIMHTYYEPANWKHIPIDNLTPETGSCAGTGELWDFTSYDYRLEDAFDKIIGVGAEDGNFRNFLVKSTGPHKAYKISFDRFNYYFDFDMTSSEKKELWTTEWNLKDEAKGLTDLDQAKAQIYTNGFTHGHLLLQWWLKNIKINFDNDFRQNFYTYATIQNYAGGASTDLISPSDAIEEDYYDKTECPYDIDCAEPLNCEFDTLWDRRLYHIRRTSYFVTYLISEIYKEKLKYLQSNFYIATGTVNVQPTIFIDPDKEFVYVYFSNVYDTYQNFLLDPENLKHLFTDIAYVDLGEATLTYLQADQLYSTSGKSSLYDKALINTCYATYDHPFEIKSETEVGIFDAIIEDEANDPQCSGSGYAINGCLSAPPLTIGYFKIPIYPIEEPFKSSDNSSNYDVKIYPNPSATFFQIKTIGEPLISAKDLKITILSLDGNIIFSAHAVINQSINISALAAGCYLALIDDGSNKFYKKIVKTE